MGARNSWMRSICAGVSGWSREPSPTQQAQVRSRARRVAAGSARSAASRMISRVASGPRSTWPRGRLARSASGNATAWPLRGLRSAGSERTSQIAATRSRFAASACSNGLRVELVLADGPAGGVAARLAGLRLDDEDAVLRVHDHEVRLAIVRRSAGARPGHEADVRVHARTRRAARRGCPPRSGARPVRRGPPNADLHPLVPSRDASRARSGGEVRRSRDTRRPARSWAPAHRLRGAGQRRWLRGAGFRLTIAI